MRKITALLALCCIGTAVVLFLPGCLKDSATRTYKIYTPNYSLKSSVLAAINGSPAQPLAQPGQLYIKDNFIYINDLNKGIHIIDNSNPSNPVQTAWLNIPGNQNIAIRGHILYADMYADLLAIDISNPGQAKIRGNLWNFFQGRGFVEDSCCVLTSWSTRDTTVPLNGGPTMYPVPGTAYYTMNSNTVAAAASSVGSKTGTAGSTAVMTLVGDYLYALPESHSVGVVQVTDSSHPTLTNKIYAGYDLETIFPIQNRLLLGSKEGVYIYSIDNPAEPVQIGQFIHGRACDPVIADESNAYVTLHAGTSCGGSANELDVLNATDLSQATLLKTYPMTHPSGLSKDGNLLFVCDGPVVKVFNTADPANLQPVTTLNVKDAYDLIAANHLLLVAGPDGLYQYDYSDVNHITLLSHLAVSGPVN
ncbi:MAG TPA: hypothetical protein VL727_24825 [Puia sp.]|nr:hypothetical protein [Puia sp.]